MKLLKSITALLLTVLVSTSIASTTIINSSSYIRSLADTGYPFEICDEINSICGPMEAVNRHEVPYHIKDEIYSYYQDRDVNASIIPEKVHYQINDQGKVVGYAVKVETDFWPRNHDDGGMETQVDYIYLTLDGRIVTVKWVD
jgi:hypothetical protein